MKLPFGFGDLDTSDWIRGMVAAFIGGGAGAVTSAFSVTAVDPEHFQMGGTKFFEVAGMVFLITGFLNMMAFLRTKPIPDMKTVTTAVATTMQPGQPPKVVTTVQETHVEPVAETKAL